jgi:hypothetical protein
MKTLLTMLLAALVLASANPAAAVQLFDFDGQAILPGAVGGNLTLYAVVVNGDAVDTPLPLDFATKQYTLAITGLRLDVDGNPQGYSGGTVALYEDAATPADLNDPATFTDGVALLSGDVTTLSRTLLTATLGTVVGSVDWTGGTRLDELAPSDRLDWTFLSTVLLAAPVHPGYDEVWDGKLEPREEVVPVSESSWGGVKARFRG